MSALAFIEMLASAFSFGEKDTGNHKHRCGVEPERYRFTRRRGRVIRFIRRAGCGLVWEHSDEMAGNHRAHLCPGCGREQYVQYPGRVSPGRGRWVKP